MFEISWKWLQPFCNRKSREYTNPTWWWVGISMLYRMFRRVNSQHLWLCARPCIQNWSKFSPNYNADQFVTFVNVNFVSWDEAKFQLIINANTNNVWQWNDKQWQCFFVCQYQMFWRGTWPHDTFGHSPHTHTSPTTERLVSETFLGCRCRLCCAIKSSRMDVIKVNARLFGFNVCEYLWIN